MGRRKNKHNKQEISPPNENRQDPPILKPEKNPKIQRDLKKDTSDSKKVDCITDIPKINETGAMELQNEISFETYHPSSERFTGREYYLYSLCQVCKRELVKKVTCPKCNLISYCSQEHRREHWPSHADLCDAVVAVCVDRGVKHIMQGAHNLPPDKFRIFRFKNMIDCETKVERPLEGWEKEMFIFPNVCGICKEYNNLVVCINCKHNSFCAGHQEKSNHSQWCEHVLQFKRIVEDQSKFGVVRPSIPVCEIQPLLPKLSDINCFFQSICKYLEKFEYLQLTEIATCPLTALNTIFKTKTELLSTKKISLHIVGAESDFETSNLEKWEYYFLHLIPNLEHLQVEFIGPELNAKTENEKYTVCKQCRIRNKSISFKFYNNLYHLCSGKSKPDLVCVFNPGLYRSTGFNGADTWSPSITNMLAYSSPVLVTEYTQKEILMDIERVNATRQILLKSGPSRNPFSSLKPSLNFVSDEESPVIFKNYFHCVM
ncbi:uncharacterized protein LOC124369723 [Homalodisca vitripennis]|uniref:uncharacterized protein LOC124369723 n=1 Tax=Homalodisca vitripennis TaxID=197043 RepID=UPI001EEA4B7C|nr:uncharacterized protein LOC124369723 [Homalodisca vitripennis]